MNNHRLIYFRKTIVYSYIYGARIDIEYHIYGTLNLWVRDTYNIMLSIVWLYIILSTYMFCSIICS